ncbi:glycoside hydrolase, partial [Nocardiopsis tropica]|nr:glycoside hydrolase [Nocardiopsis tropica]
MHRPRGRTGPRHASPEAPARRRGGPARPALLAAGAALLLTGAALPALTGPVPATTAAATGAAAVPVGSGSYTDTLPAGASGPSDLSGAPASPKVTDDYEGAAPTNEWWSSLIFQRYPENPHGENLFAHPASYHPHEGGLEMGYPDTPRLVADGLKYEFPHVPDLSLGAVGLDSPDTRVADSGDWTVTAEWAGGGPTLRVTIGQGLPFAYAETSGGDAEVSFSSAPDVWHEDGSVGGASDGGRHYAVFAPSGSPSTRTGDAVSAATGDARPHSLAVLPSP